jgi:hypothetical protein
MREQPALYLLLTSSYPPVQQRISLKVYGACFTATKQRLSSRSTNLIVASAAIHRAIFCGKEWNLGFSSTLVTNNCVHFSRGALRTISRPTRSSTACSSAGRAASRLVHQALLLVEFLFSYCEYEIVSALTAF